MKVQSTWLQTSFSERMTHVKRGLWSAWCLMFLFVVGGLSVGCGTPDAVGPKCEKKVCTEELSGGSKRTIVDATSKEAWIYFSFKTGAEVKVTSPKTDTSWDLGFQRSNIKSNGGNSGKGGVEVVILEDKEFASVDKAPADGYVVDETDKQDDDGVPQYAFLKKGNWYNYSLATHILTPKKRVYVVKSVDGSHYKVKIHSYYNSAEKSGFPSFDWVKIASK